MAPLRERGRSTPHDLPGAFRLCAVERDRVRSRLWDRRTPPDHIKLYDTQHPTCAYKEVGSVTTEGRFLASWSSVVRKARDKAHEMGGDAIVGVNENTRISGAVPSKGSISTTQATSISGTVIRFADPACRE